MVSRHFGAGIYRLSLFALELGRLCRQHLLRLDRVRVRPEKIWVSRRSSRRRWRSRMAACAVR
jgi:hypothetical protein